MQLPDSLLGEAVRIEKERKEKGSPASLEETKIRSEWLQETLRKRCLPVGTGAGLLTYLYVKNGIF